MSQDNSLRHIPVIILTATTDAETKREALSMGATDFLSKPVDSNDLVPRVRNALVVKAHQDHLANYAVELERQVNARTAELARSRAEVIHCLARAAEYRDDDTGHHVLRVGKYVGIIARELGFGGSQAETIELAAQLHDIGKIGIPDSILLNPGKLDQDQYAFMQKHCAIGKQIIQPMAEHDWRKLKTHTELGSGIVGVSSSPLLMTASRIAQSHHEKWDGSGYPLGLAGDDIPIEGRITAVADVYDALSSARPYKPPFPREKCFEILRVERGKHFDPQVVDAFFARSEDIVKVQLDYMDLP
jgi:putative two-component system response regulator